jgi:hypothetical protein
MSLRRQHLDRSFREPQWAIRVITLVILLLGAAGVLYAFTRAEARRERHLRGIEAGDSATLLVERLGTPPHVCPTGTLAHLEGQFPAGWPAAAQTRAIEELRQQTGERWLYPLREKNTNPCSIPQGSTEAGIARDGRVLWLLPLHGRQPLRLPPEFAPGTLLNDTL